MEDGLVKIVSPIEGSPAFRAGLKSGDLITKIDDTAVKGLTLDEAVKRMRGEPNTKVMLTIFRKNENRTFPVTITREEIHVQSVKAKMVEPGYGWIRITQFQDRTVDDFARKLEDLYKQDPQMKGLVLDLRNDPGGLLESAVAVAAAFLPANAVVVSTNGQIPESKATFRATPDDYLRRGGSDPLKKLPAALKTVPWWCWSTKARPRPARSSPARCRTTSAPPSWAPRPSARARCRRCARSRPTPR
jgi:carboxyl-terminal processing protease